MESGYDEYWSTLKRVHIAYEQNIKQIVSQLDQRALDRQTDCVECCELSKSAGRMTKRWRNMTSLSVETFSLLNSQISQERQSLQDLELQVLQQNKNVIDLNKEASKLKKLVDILENAIWQETSKPKPK